MPAPGQGYGFYDFLVHLWTGNIPGENYVGQQWEYILGDDPFPPIPPLFDLPEVNIEKIAIIATIIIAVSVIVYKKL